ncbi:MAG: hypothetical protein COA70_00830 [Planctomycetota bacterium]|nr:MAG: hypothetical protein COA70_00830 [Planctomycetota bacterium]
MSFLSGILLIALAIGIGRAILPSRARLQRSLWEELGVAYLLGTAAIAVVVTAGFAIGLSMNLLWWLPLLGGIGAWAMWWKGRQNQEALAEVTWSQGVGWLLLAVAAASFAAALALPLNEFDPIYHFAYRGKVLHFEGSPLSEAITGMVHPDGYGRMVTHPNYPFGIPILEAWVAHLDGWSERWVQLPLALWSACLPMAISLGLRNTSFQAASMGAIITAATPMLYSANFPVDGFGNLSMAGLGGETMIGGGADLAVMAMFGAACALLVRAYQSQDRRTAVCASLALAGGVVMKNEGLGLAGVLILAVLLAQLFPPRRTKVLLPFVIISVVLILPWIGLRAQLPAIDENYSEQMSVENLMHFLGGGRELVEKSPLAFNSREPIDFENAPSRIGLVSEAFGSEFVDWRSWGVLWLLALLGLPLTLKRLRQVELRWLGMVVVGGVLLYFLILLVTPWNFPSLRDKGIPERLLVHLVGPIALLFAAANFPKAVSGLEKETQS